MIKQNMNLDVYVCETCGCIHLTPNEFFSIGGVELCTDCLNEVEFIEDPNYGIVAILELDTRN